MRDVAQDVHSQLGDVDEVRRLYSLQCESSTDKSKRFANLVRIILVCERTAFSSLEVFFHQLLINIASKEEETKTCKNINTGTYPLN